MAFVFAFAAILLANAYGGQLGELAQSLFGNIPEAFAEDLVNGTSNTPATAADSNSASNAVGALGRGVGTVVSGLATLFIKLIGGILYFVLKWMGPLMDNTFILEGDIGEKLRSVWVIVRNFVNIFFALALVIVALMSVVGYGDEGGNYALKKFIPKMALALIAVNFTFLACRIVLDINNVLTTAIFAIPQSVTTVGDIGPSGTAGQTIFKKFKCFDSTPGVSADAQVKNAQTLEKNYNGTIASLGGVCFAQDPGSQSYDTLVSSGNKTDKNKQAIISMDQSQYTKKDFVWVMATQFQGIHDLNKVSVLLDPTFSGLTVNALFSVVFAVIYATAYISMFIILIARMAVLWVTIMLSPLVAISIVFPDLKLDDFDIQERFLSHAFVPAKMALPLSLGYIMLSQMTLAVDGSSGIFKDSVIDIAAGGEFARGVSFTTLIYGAASVAVLWMGVFSATKGVVGEGVVSTFSDSIKSVGGAVAKWPTYIPLSPVSNGMTLSGLKYTASELSTRLGEVQRGRNEKYAGSVLDKYFPNSTIKSAINRVVDSAKNGHVDRASLATVAGDGATSAQFSDTLKETLTALEGKDDKKRELATLAGYGSDFVGFERDVRSGDRAKLETIKTRIKASAAGPVTSNKADYSGIDVGLSDLKPADINSSVNIETVIDDEEIRKKLGVSNTDRKLKLDSPEVFASTIKDGKLSSEGLRVIAQTGVFDQIALKKESTRSVISGDTQLLLKFSRSIDRSNADKAGNIALKTAFMKLTKTNNDIDLKKLGGAGIQMAAIDAAGEYDEKKTSP